MARRKQQEKAPTQVLEQGNIYFLYRPRVGKEAAEVRGLDDVQRLYLVLSPQGARRYRLMVVPKKQMPKAGSADPRFWGFVEKAARRPQEVEDDLDRKTYQTKTRGERALPEARPVAEGIYSIVRHGDHTHLTYALELPKEPGEVQRAVNIEPEAGYIISVKNPEQPAPQGVGLDEEEQASFPKKLQSRFRERRFAPLDPPDFLNYPGAEVLFINTGEDASEELGIELDAEEESESTADIFNDLRLEKSEHPTEPIFQGRWA